MIRTRLKILLVISPFFLLMGCDPSAETTTESHLPPGAPTQVEATPTICVGVMSGDSLQEFDRVVTPFLLPDQRLVVPLTGSKELRLFDSQGEYLATLGRDGEGPGEFASIGAAWPRGDTIEVFDSRLLRITQFFPTGEAKVVLLDRVPSAQSALPGALSVGWAISGVAAAEMGKRDQVALHRFDRAGTHLGEVAHFEGMARYRIPNFSGPDPLSPKTVFAIGDDKVFAGETLSPTLTVFSPDGLEQGRVTWDPGVPIPPGEAYRQVVEEVVSQAEPDRAEETRGRLSAFPRPDRVSVFWATIVDEMGFLWIRPFDPLQHSLELGMYHGAGVGGEWIVLSQAGKRIGSVLMPPRLEPASITTGAVVGVERNEMDVESVCVYPVTRQGL